MKLPLYAVLAVLAALLPWSQRRVERALGEYSAQEEVLYIGSGEYLRRLSPGFEDVMADVYWLRTVQYFGAHRANDGQRYELLQPLIDITVALDERFEMAYQFGAIFLAEPSPQGAGEPEKAVQLLERGVQRTGSHVLQHLEAHILYLHLDDAQRAAAILLDIARTHKGAMPFEALAADMLQRRNQHEVARRIWKGMYDSYSGQIRDNARWNLERLDALDGVRAVQARIDAATKSLGRPPASLTRVIGRAPVDPAGVPFDYDPATGRVSIGKRSRYWLPHRDNY